MDEEKLKADAKKEIHLLVEQFRKTESTYKSERDVCRVYLEPLFGLLGWNFKDLHEVKEQVSQPEGRPDYIFYLNGSVAFFLETKKVQELTEKDLKQAVNYGRSKNKRWAVLSNFKETLILICDTKETSISKHIFRRIGYNELEDRIGDLFLLSKTSLESGTLDKKAQYEGRVKKTVRIDDELLNDIVKWKQTLTVSIKKNTSKEYTKEDLAEIVQTLLDRIIFIRTVEDRKHEARPDETIKAILNQYEKDKSISIKDRLNKLFKEYDEAYNSKLFTYKESDSQRRHECERVEIDSPTYYKILKETYDKDEIYSYNFAEIDADVLGSMYERYIGQMQATRKEQGIYYTPAYIVEYIVMNTLGELLKNKKPADVGKICILDPACGSGSFLLKAFDTLDRYYKKQGERFEGTKKHEKQYAQTQLDLENKTAIMTRKTKILLNNLYGVDLDPKAVEIAQLNLLLKAAEQRHRLPTLQDNIKCGNSLIDDPSVAGERAFKWEEKFNGIMKEGGFDVIIGNPPYGYRGIPTPEIKEAYRKKYVTSEGNFDMYRFFIERSISLLKENGVLGFIIPNTFLTANSYKKMRSYILEHCSIKKIADLGLDVFEGVTIESIIIILQKNQKKDKKSNAVDIVVCRSRSLSLYAPTAQYQIKQERFSTAKEQTFNIYLNPTANKITEKMKDGSNLLEKIAYVTVGINTGYIKDALVSSKKLDDRYHKLLSGRDISRYSLGWPGEWILYDKAVVDSYGDKGRTLPDRNIFDSEKILVQRTRRGMARKLVCTLDADKFYNLNRLSNVVMTNKDYSINYCLGILNSILMDFYFQKTYNEYEVKPAHLRQLPIKNISKSEQGPIISLVDRMLSLNKKLAELGDKQTDERARLEKEIAETDRKIDELVYDLYGLSQEERKIVEESVK